MTFKTSDSFHSTVQNVGQCNHVFSWYLSSGSVVYAVILRAIAFKLSPLGVFAAVFIYFITLKY